MGLRDSSHLLVALLVLVCHAIRVPFLLGQNAVRTACTRVQVSVCARQKCACVIVSTIWNSMLCVYGGARAHACMGAAVNIYGV
jgi:hypothetical protein